MYQPKIACYIAFSTSLLSHFQKPNTMKTSFIGSPLWLSGSCHVIHRHTTPLFLTSSAQSFFFKTFLSVLLFAAISRQVQAQSFPCNTFVKKVDNVGRNEPRIFKDPSASNYYMTASSNDTIFISNVNATGTVLTTQNIILPNNDVGSVTDMIVDQVDGTLAAVIRGNNNNYMFKYDYAAAVMNWFKSYPSSYIFQNIHQVSPNNDYVVTGEILLGGITIFQVIRSTGVMSPYQNSGFVGEFFSATDGTDVYGACRYYTTASTIFNPSLYKFDGNTGNNIWVNAYIKNTATMRIYPVAPVIDQGSIMQLSSGNDQNFNTYLTGTTKIWLLNTDMNGNLNWTNQITITGCTRPNVKKIINTATGYYLLIDSYNGSIVNYFYVVKTDKNGNVQWANRYGISGQNTVISGIEDNGFLFLTAISGSYSTSNDVLLLKLDQNGLTDVNCSYINKANASAATYNNLQVTKPTVTNPTNYSNNSANYTLFKKRPVETVYCSATCTTLPCNTLTGTLASGVLAFYPFGYGSLNDVSGNGYNLNNSTTAYSTADRSGNPNCAYHFERTLGDFLDRSASGSTFLNGLTNNAFSLSIWFRPTYDATRGVGDYELLMGRGATGLHCPDTWGEWSAGLYDCRKAVVGLDQYSHWEGAGPGCAVLMAGGVWRHLAFVYDGIGTYSLYIDGTLFSTSSGPCGPLSGNVGPLMLGVDYTGDLDDIIIYNRALSSTEVLALKSLNGSCCDGTTSSNKAQHTGVNTLAEHKGIKLYPNPTSGLVSVSAGSVIRKVEIYSSTGALTEYYRFNATEVSVNMDNMASGIYFIKVITDSGSFLEKVIRE